VSPTPRDHSRTAEQTVQHKTKATHSEDRVDWLLRCSETSDNGWFEVDCSTPPPADTQTGSLACTFYLVFKEPFTAAQTRLRVCPASTVAPPAHALSVVVRGTFQSYRSDFLVSTAFRLAQQVFLAGR